MFADATQRQRISMCAAAAFACVPVVALGTAFGQAIPVTRTIHVQKVTVHRTVEKVTRIIIPAHPKRDYPPLADPKLACTGAPVIITHIAVSGWQGEASDDKAVDTWLTVRPVGDDYTVNCYLEGDYSGGWNEGDLVSLINGHVAG